ncbi:MAG TPA: response regulator [Acidobacteriaceae bacterium]|nr:response regulator [Acidobacteriaceae bacterium]
MTLSLKESFSRSDGSRLRVLIADDEKNIAETIRIILTKEGMDAVAVYGGRAAVEKAAEWKPDILLVDYLMPDLNGLEAARRICERHAACRVLVLSALAAVHELRQELVRCDHPCEVLVKPIHPTDLLRLIRAVGGP